MKLTYARRYRRNPSRSKDLAMFKKDSQHEHSFFSAPTQETFFKPFVAVQRKCAHCEAEDKKASRMSATNDEEKKVQKMSDEKEEEKKVSLKTEEEKEKNVQRMSDAKEEEKKIQKITDKKEDKELHRATEKKEEEEKVAKKEAGSSDQSASVSTYIHSLDGKGQALPEDVRHFFCERMDYDFSAVKIHTGADAETSAKKINAKAYTVDKHIVFGKGQYNPESDEGKKLLAHELTHVVQNGNAASLNRKTLNAEEEKDETISGSATKAKNKSAQGNCEGVNVQGRTDFNPLPSSFTANGTTRPSTACEECTAPDCITARGTIVSRFRSNITVTLPAVPDGLSPCEATAVRRFINTTLRQHEQQHVAAFSTYNGTVRTPYTFTGCRSGLQDHIQSIHDGIDAQRSASAIAQSDALDPFVRPIPCNCE